MVDATWGDKVLTWQRYASNSVDHLHLKQCSRALTEGRAVLWRWIQEKVEWSSWDVSEVCKGINM